MTTAEEIALQYAVDRGLSCAMWRVLRDAMLERDRLQQRLAEIDASWAKLRDFPWETQLDEAEREGEERR
jgi:hypothetical protein